MVGAMSPSEPARARLAVVGVTALALAVNCWSLSINGLGNQYYAAATRSMSMSWHNFFFAAFDPGGFISVDKPPVALWAAALSARVFGLSSWSVLLPSALAGTAAVALLWCTVRRRFGVPAATIAALVLAVSPVNVAVNRLNLPEPFLILFLVATAWAVLRSLDAERPLGWLVLAGAFVGLAFNTKMLAAFIPLPALGLGLLMGTRGWVPKLQRGAVFGLAALAFSAPWIIAVDLVPAAARPYVGGSTDNTVLDLVLGYNGFGRVNGATAGGGIGGGGRGGGLLGGSMSAAGGVFGGVAGPFRLFSDAVGGQIAWLLPLAVMGLVAAVWLHRRDRSRRAALVLWAGWLALYAVVFSLARGTFHSYYTAVMTPALAALVGIGAAALVQLLRRDRRWFALLGAGMAATLTLELGLAGRHPTFYGWARLPVIVLVGGAVALLVTAVVARRGRLMLWALAVAMAASLVLPAAWAVSETANPVLNATLPQAGPRTGTAGTTFGSTASNGDAALADYLVAHRAGERWDVLVASAQTGSGLIAYDDVSVLAVGGFMGTDRSLTVARFADLVAAGEVRFVLGGGGGGAGAGPGATGGAASSIIAAAQQSCAAVDAVTPSGGTLYDCAGRAAAIGTRA